MSWAFLCLYDKLGFRARPALAAIVGATRNPRDSGASVGPSVPRSASDELCHPAAYALATCATASW